MPPVLQRDAARTRRALLDAAARAIIVHGSAVSLDVVARQAGVSKGGLLHHFRSRDALLVGLAVEWLDRFDAAVQRHLDPGDHRPGRLCRAHIRATFDLDADAGEQAWHDPAVLTALLGVPEVLQHGRESDRRWRSELAADGLHPQRVQIIASMLDGMSMGRLFGHQPDADERDQTRTLLLALTEDAGPLIADTAGAA